MSNPLTPNVLNTVSIESDRPSILQKIRYIPLHFYKLTVGLGVIIFCILGATNVRATYTFPEIRMVQGFDVMTITPSEPLQGKVSTRWRMYREESDEILKHGARLDDMDKKRGIQVNIPGFGKHIFELGGQGERFIFDFAFCPAKTHTDDADISDECSPVFQKKITYNPITYASGYCTSITKPRGNDIVVTILGGDGSITEECQFDEDSFDILYGDASIIDVTDSQVVLNATLHGMSLIKTTHGDASVKIFTFPQSTESQPDTVEQNCDIKIEGKSDKFILRIDSTNQESESTCTFDNYNYEAIGGNMEVLDHNKNTIIFNRWKRGRIRLQHKDSSQDWFEFDVFKTHSTSSMPLSYSCWPEARYENGNYVVNIATINEGYDCHFGSDLTAIKILEGNTTLISQNREQVVLDGTESVLVRLFYYVVTDEHGTGYSEIYLIPPLDQDNTAQTNGEEEEEEEEEEDEDQGIAQPIIKFEDDVFEYREDKPNPFPDTDPLRLEGQAAKYLYYRGVIGGYPDGEFKGWKLVNRAEAAKFLINSVGEEIPEGLHNNSRFSDVLDGEWYTRFVLHAVDLGILKGDDHNDTLRPADGVNTVEFLAMLTRAFGLTENMPHNYEDVTSDDWFNKYAGVAKKYDLFPSRGTLLFPGKQLTRDEVSVAIYQLIDNGM